MAKKAKVELSEKIVNGCEKLWPKGMIDVMDDSEGITVVVDDRTLEGQRVQDRIHWHSAHGFISIVAGAESIEPDQPHILFYTIADARG